MTCESTFGQRKTIGGFLSNLPVPVNCVRSSWDLVRRATSIVSVVYLVHRFVVAILKNGHLTLVVVKAAETVFVGVFLWMSARNAVGQVFGNGIEMLLLQSTVATGAMTAAASRMI